MKRLEKCELDATRWSGQEGGIYRGLGLAFPRPSKSPLLFLFFVGIVVRVIFVVRVVLLRR
jgi:hypothetical protein